MQPRKIVVGIHKGGVGKTTTVVNLAGALAEAGANVLLIDCDSQGDLSAMFIDDHESLPYSVADIFNETGVTTDEIIRPTEFANISIIPADRRLELLERTANYYGDPRVADLAEAIGEVGGAFDVVLMDTATRPHFTGYAALAAAHQLLVPLQGARFSFRAIASILQQVDRVRSSINRGLMVHYFLSQSKSSKTHQTYREVLIGELGPEMVLAAEVPDHETVRTAANLRKPVVFHAKRSKSAEAVRQLANELISKGQSHYESNEAAA